MDDLEQHQALPALHPKIKWLVAMAASPVTELDGRIRRKRRSD